MINQVMLVGRIVAIENIKNEEKKQTIVTIAVNRSFKNVNGIYDTDFIKIIIWNAIANNVSEYCENGDLIGVRGRLRCGVENNNLEIIADKVTFLSTKQNLKTKEEHSYKNEESEED